LILVVAALMSLAWDISLPAFQGPDEDAQFAYLQYLAETGRPPSGTTGTGSASTEESDALGWLNLESLRGVLGARPAWSSADLAAWHRIERSMPNGSRANGSGPNAAAGYPPLYFALMAIPYHLFIWLPLFKRLFVLRLFSALFRLGTIALTWLLAGEVFGRVRWKQTLAAGAVALEPQLAFMSAAISADNLLAMLGTAFLLSAVRLVKRGPTMSRVLATSALAAASTVTQGRGLVTLPVLAFALLVAFVRHPNRARDVIKRVGVAVAAVAAAPLAYLLYLAAAHGGSFYGSAIGTVNSGRFSFRQFLSSIYQFYFPPLPGMAPRIGPAYGYRQVFIETFFGTFGWLEVQFSARVYELLEVLSALGLVGLYTACVVRWRALRESWHVAAVLFAALFTLVLFLHYVSYRSLLTNGGTDPVIVGRYLFPIVSLFGLAIAFTVGSLPRRAGVVLGGVILGGGVLLTLGSIGITMAQFYA
jgi:4-amino-4-deoxy-L-arabinose transferase-like glycosyltransferase